MKKIFRSIALLCMGYATLACVEENLEIVNTNPGDDIAFCATAGIESASKSTKTEYGETFLGSDNKKYIKINWSNNDRVVIASPQTATEKGYYYITRNETSKNQATSLTKESSAGLQWSNESIYDFYAVYPAFDYDPENNTNATSKLEINESNQGVFTGSMPIYQRHDLTENNGNYIAAPDMRYAFMTAKCNDFVKGSLDEDGNPLPINLPFKSLVTALQFKITANTINIAVDSNDDSTADATFSSMDIMSVSLLCNGQDISGTFEYNIESGSYNTVSGTNRVYMHFEDEHVSLSKDKVLDLTFFLLPETILPEDELQLQIVFKIGTTPMSRTATINQKIEGGKKYVFNDVLLPEFTGGQVPPSSWFDTLDPEVLMSQLSIPVASNVFASSKYITSGDATKSLHQILDYTDLWDMGVRGFEFVNRRALPVTKESLYDAHFVTDEYPYESTSVNFGTAFETLTRRLKENPKEFLAIICTYQATGDGYSPDAYVSQLLKFLDDFVANDEDFEKNDFIQLTSLTSVAEAQGNIAIIIRPGDDDRYETKNYTREINLGSWSSNITLIHDWGTAFDVWDRRYQDAARQSTYETLYVVEKAKKKTTANPIQIEDWLWGVSSSQSNYLNVEGYHDFNPVLGHDTSPDDEIVPLAMPSKLDKFNFSHNMTGPSGTAFVQEWARVAKGQIKTYTGISRSRRYLWVDWPDSYTEKKKAIYDLFELSVEERLKKSPNIYINSLSGYYIDKDITPRGLYPFKYRFDGYWSEGGIFGIGEYNDVTGQGKGGDHVGLAYDLNRFTYDILSGKSNEFDSLDKGPWGYVMIEHIGNTTKQTADAPDMSEELVELIMMNNFKFEMSTKCKDCNQYPCVCQDTRATYNATYTNGGNAISFE